MVLLLLACGPKIDPLAPLQQSLQQARDSGPAQSPHLRFAVSEKTVGDLLLEAINPEKPFVVPVMLGTVAAIRIELDRPDLSTAYQEPCACTTASMETRGRIDVDVAGLLGKQVLADDLGFSARLGGAPTFRMVQEADGLSVRLEGHPEHPWTVDLELDEEKGFLTNKLVDNQFEGPVAGFLAKSIEVAKLGEDVPLQPARISVVPEEGLMLDVWIAAEASEAPPALQVDEGWGISLTDSGVTAIARAALAGVEQHKRWKIEPLHVQIRERRFRSKLRVHRVTRKVQWRDYLVEGNIIESPEGFRIEPDLVTEIAKAGWSGSVIGGFVTPTVRKQILKRQIDLPRAFETRDERYPTRWEVREVDASDQGLFVRGSLELLPPKPAAAADEASGETPDGPQEQP